MWQTISCAFVIPWFFRAPHVPPAAMDTLIICFVCLNDLSSLDCPAHVSSRRFPSCPRCTHSTYRATALRPRRTATPCARGRASRVRRRCACCDWPAMRCAARIRTLDFRWCFVDLGMAKTNNIHIFVFESRVSGICKFQSDCLISIISEVTMFLASQRVRSSLFARSSDARVRRRCETLGFRRAPFGGAFARIVGCIDKCRRKRNRLCERSCVDLVHILIGIITGCE